MSFISTVFSFSNINFNKLFPFHFIINRNLQIVSVGPSLLKLQSGLNSEYLVNHFSFLRPAFIENKFDSIKTYESQVIILNSKTNTDLKLRGQVINIDENHILFVGSPWINNVDDLKSLGLTISDFAVHDTSLDMVQVIKTMEIVQNDLELLISQLKSKEEKLKLSKADAANRSEFLNTLMEGIRSGILFENIDGEIMYLNNSFCSMFNISENKNELIGIKCALFAKAAANFFVEPDVFLERIQVLLNNKQPYKNEELELVNGQIIERDFLPIYNDDEYIGTLWVYRDITERRIKDTQLALYKRLFDNSTDAIQISDEEGQLIYINNEAAKRLGIKSEQCSKYNVIDFENIFNDKNSWKQHIDELKHKKNMLIKGENKNVVTGEIFPVEVSVALVSVDGKYYVVADSRNISDRVKIENQLKLQKEKAEQLSTAKDAFMANISHELRNPLNVITGITTLFNLDNLTPTQKDYLGIINSSSSNLLNLVNDILDYEKIEQQKIVLKEQTFNVHEIIKSVIDAYTYVANSKDVRLNYNYNKPDVTVIGDAERLKQIMSNLIANAFKFTESGTVSVVSTIHELDNTVKLFLEINDTGIGIPETDLPIIFDRYARSSQVENKYSGTGLGLSIVKNILELMGGSISVTSKIDEGTSVKLEIPFKQGYLNDLSLAQYDLKKLPNNFSSKKVLVVEDNKINQLITLNYLENNNFNVEVAENGAVALEKIKAVKYDYILMDIQMPVLNGFETLEILKNDTDFSSFNTPIIALTANVNYGEKEKCIKLGFSNYLSKPFSESQLIEVIIKTQNKNYNYLNVDSLNEFCKFNSELAKQVLEDFSASAPDKLAHMVHASKSNDFLKVSAIAHNLKSSLGYLGANELYTLANEIELLIKSNEEDAIDDKLNNFLNACNELITEVNVELKS